MIADSSRWNEEISSAPIASCFENPARLVVADVGAHDNPRPSSTRDRSTVRRGDLHGRERSVVRSGGRVVCVSALARCPPLTLFPLPPLRQPFLQKGGHAFGKVWLSGHAFQKRRGISDGGAHIAMQVGVNLPFGYF